MTNEAVGVVPTPAEEARFWALLETAWSAQGKEVNAARRALASRDPEDEAETEALEDALQEVVEHLRIALMTSTQEELVAVDRVIERKLFDLDRSDVHAVIDGSDDGFLYGRGYVVALGKAYYEAVNARPEVAVQDGECEELCYLAAHLHESRFGKYPETGSNISRESSSNGPGWAED